MVSVVTLYVHAEHRETVDVHGGRKCPCSLDPRSSRRRPRRCRRCAQIRSGAGCVHRCSPGAERPFCDRRRGPGVVWPPSSSAIDRELADVAGLIESRISLGEPSAVHLLSDSRGETEDFSSPYR
jgi:hypothetical protein